MFDYENPFEEETVETECGEDSVIDATEEVAPAWETADWEKVTEGHAEGAVHAEERMYTEADKERIYCNIRRKRKERTEIRAVRYAMLAAGFAALAYLIRDTGWLASTLCGVSVWFGLISAYGIGKCREM